jgi:hypothetical protein
LPAAARGGEIAIFRSGHKTLGKGSKAKAVFRAALS